MRRPKHLSKKQENNGDQMTGAGLAFELWRQLPTPRTIAALREAFKRRDIQPPAPSTIHRWKKGGDWENRLKQSELAEYKEQVLEQSKEDRVFVLSVSKHQADYASIPERAGETIIECMSGMEGKMILATQRLVIPEVVKPRDLKDLSDVYRNFAAICKTFHDLRMELEGLSSVITELGLEEYVP